MRAILLVFLLLPALYCEARVGASRADCVRLYGNSLGGEDNSFVFVQDKLVFVCDFDEATDHCISMTIRLKSKAPLTQDAVEGLLRANPGAGEWTADTSLKTNWQHSSGKWQANLDGLALSIQALSP